MIENWDLIDNWGNYLTSLHLDCRKGNGHSVSRFTHETHDLYTIHVFYLLYNT